MIRIVPTVLYFIIALLAFPLTFAISVSPAFAHVAPAMNAGPATPLA